jgi:aspartyl-tRNA(Asn)/glutamyl-tRNA(Gln) amidotransferase subunit A
MDLLEQSVAQLQQLVSKKELTATELVGAHLERIEAVEEKVRAFSHVSAELALHQAARLDESFSSEGRPVGRLHGVPIGVKDIVDVAGCPTSCNSAHMADNHPASDATAVRRLREAGAVIIGKVNTHEFASGVTTPPTRNPWDLDLIPGGSSGGSGAAVSARECVGALGTDTGGSIRIPAALCGVVGYKPSFGVVPRVGVASLSWSFDHVGPLARSVEDAAVVAAAMAGFDADDPASVSVPGPPLDEGLHRGLAEGTTIGVPTNAFANRNRPEVDEAVARSLALMADAGARVVDIDLPEADRIYPEVLLAIELTEAAAYHHDRLETAPDLFSDDVRQLYEAGRHIPGYIYVNALRVRRHIQTAWRRAMSGVDLLVVPTVPAGAMPVNVMEVAWPDGRNESIFDLYVRTCAPASLLGLPAVSLPAGFTSGGTPIGVQLIGKPYADSELLRVAAALEGDLAFPRTTPSGLTR